MSFLGSAKEFFGLGPVDHGDDVVDDAYYDDAVPASSSRAGATSSRAGATGSTVAGASAYPREPQRDSRRGATTGSSYRAVGYTPHIVTASPRTYNDAKEIGEPFRDGDAVVMDLTGLETADAKRIVDFAAGLCFALRGNMHNLSRGVDSQRRVFAIVPENAGVDEDELRRAARLN